ncbi:hypothetical protein [Bdellovibrio svalbardensis]|uniref:Uncharacterized protein n=1 Tax=Bdellovibrio svalbardensis TaxID=2972972 RepID=A0ABT6DHN3_9BACT|nr:hypothetical protein [Bdellovibrio svalbardensis]MDG0816306.1 hypothetical protein [Bdellovibrio svalbardensis]
MKRILVVLVLTMTGVFAQANDDMTTQGKLSWTCGLAFKGSSMGVKVIVGKFTTESVGTLKCIDLEGNHFQRDVKVTMDSHFIGPVVGLGYFKFAGLSSEISLFNCSPEVLFGNYLVAQGQGAIIGGAGTFAAVRVKPPEIAVNIALKLVKGLGVQVGIERMKISPL